MKLPVICRTCDARDTDSLHNLASYTKKYPEKTLSDLLAELTEIDVNGTSTQKLPRSLCGECTRKLVGAYYFVEQARAAHELLMSQLYSNATALECLQEAPITMELCAEQHVEVKLEEQIDEIDNEITCTELPELSLAHSSDDVDMGNDSEPEEKKSIDPLIMLDAIKQEAHASAEVDRSCDQTDDDDSTDDLPLKQRMRIKPQKFKAKLRRSRAYKCNQCSKSFNKVDYLKLHSARIHDKKPESFSCTFCIRKFNRHDALQTHLKVHRESKRSVNLNERKKAKDIDVNLCKPHGYKLIECMICQSKYDTISELRRHMEAHPEITTFADHHSLELNEVTELFYPDIKDLTEEQLKSQINKDLAAGNYQRFYSITNQSGYELDLSCSETESETELDAGDQPIRRKAQKEKYFCELCQQKYQRKYQLYEHQRQTHPWSEAPHICGRCDARFVSLRLLIHHNESQCKNAQKRFLCHKCPLRFRWKHNLKTHIRDHRSINQSFECHECKRVFDKQKSLTVHLLSVHADESKLIPCQWCSRKFYRRDYLLKHLKRHGIKEEDIPLAETLIAATSKAHGIKSISCKICNINFDRISDLRAHIQLELKLALSLHQNYNSLENYSITNESGFELQLDDSETDDEMTASFKQPTVYVCELCQVHCRRKYEMIQHQRAMHRFDKMPYECEKCIFKCVSKNIMEYHREVQCLNVQKKNACDKCSYKFMWPENLEQHMRLHHGGLECKLTKTTLTAPTTSKKEVSETGTGSSGIQLLQCPHCDRTYQMKSRLNNHIRDVHVNGDRKRLAAMKKFLCSLCGTETQSAATLVTHMRRHTGEKPFKCDLCEMAFPRHSEMISHRRMHTGEKPYHCTVCGKDFARSDKLKRHMLIHSGLKPHKCTYCEKSYRQAKDLKLHLQQHTGECPFVCGTCGERFIQSSTLEKHRMMRRHFDEVQ